MIQFPHALQTFQSRIYMAPLRQGSENFSSHPLPISSSTPVLTMKNFLVAVGVCIGIELVLFAMYFLRKYIRHYKMTPGERYGEELHQLMLQMKKVIYIGDHDEGLYVHRNDDFRTRQHILLGFRYIDFTDSEGLFPPDHVMAPGGLHVPMLLDVIEGEEVY